MQPAIDTIHTNGMTTILTQTFHICCSEILLFFYDRVLTDSISKVFVWPLIYSKQSPSFSTCIHFKFKQLNLSTM